MDVQFIFLLCLVIQVILPAYSVIWVTNGADAVKEINKRMDEMKKAQLIFDEKLDGKLSALDKSLKDLKPPAKKEEKKKGPDKMDVAEAVGEALEGLPGIVTGLQTKNYATALKSGMKVVTSIVNLFVPGTAKVANMILKAFNNIQSLFTGAKIRKPESPIIKALQKFKVEGIEDEIAGIEYLWNMMLKSISHFEDYLNNNAVITEQLASQFYSNSFQKIGIFGRLDKMIKDYCKGKSHANDDGSDITENIDVCLSLLASYARLAISRGILLARLAGITLQAEDHYKDLLEDPKYASMKEKIGRKAQEMGGYKENFIYLADQQRSMDKDVLRFLGDPLNQFQSKRVIFELFAHPGEYHILMSYLMSLDDQYDFLTDSKHVIVCPEKKLSGLCRKQAITKEMTYFNPKNSPIKSWFVPAGLQIYFKGQDDVEYGPFIGMFAYSPENIATFEKVKVQEMDRDKFQDAADNIMICNTENMCDTVDSKILTSHNMKSYHGVSYQKIRKVKVPEGVKVTLSALDESKSPKKINGPLVGPFKQKNIQECYSEWTTLTVEKAGEDEDGRKYVEVCGPKDQFCTQFEPGKVVETSSSGFLGFFKGSNDLKCKPTPESDMLNIRIPVGRSVTVKKGESTAGPIKGPAFYPGMNINDMTIQVEDLWLGDDKGKKRTMQQYFADHSAKHHHHHFHHHRHGNQTNLEDDSNNSLV